jgi:hypothetical protein
MNPVQLTIRSADFVPSMTTTGISEEASVMSCHLEEIFDELIGSLALGAAYAAAVEDLSEVIEESSSSDWDGYGARPVGSPTCFNALRFLRALPWDVPVPEVAAEPDGEISFEWYRGSRSVFSVSVGPGRRLTYAGIFGSNEAHGTEHFFDELPKTILGNLQRLLS